MCFCIKIHVPFKNVLKYNNKHIINLNLIKTKCRNQTQRYRDEN